MCWTNENVPRNHQSEASPKQASMLLLLYVARAIDASISIQPLQQLIAEYAAPIVLHHVKFTSVCQHTGEIVYLFLPWNRNERELVALFRLIRNRDDQTDERLDGIDLCNDIDLDIDTKLTDEQVDTLVAHANEPDNRTYQKVSGRMMIPYLNGSTTEYDWKKVQDSIYIYRMRELFKES